MFGLTMSKDYLNEILDGSKTFDARSYPTNRSGLIVLIDSRSIKIHRTIELVISLLDIKKAFIVLDDYLI